MMTEMLKMWMQMTMEETTLNRKGNLKLGWRQYSSRRAALTEMTAKMPKIFEEGSQWLLRMTE